VDSQQQAAKGLVREKEMMENGVTVAMGNLVATRSAHVEDVGTNSPMAINVQPITIAGLVIVRGLGGGVHWVAMEHAGRKRLVKLLTKRLSY